MKRKRTTRKRQAARKAAEPNRLVLTVPEAGQLLGLSRYSSYEAVKRGELPVIKIGPRLLVPREALEKMLAEARPRAAISSTEAAGTVPMAARSRE